MRWLLVFLVAALLFNGLHRVMEKIGLGRLPGDFKFRIRGRDWYLPLASSAVLSLVVGLIALVV
jgi:hypothetical protein